MSYALGQAAGPGDTVGPYTVESGQLSLPTRIAMSWGAWPDQEHPVVLSTSGGVTMRTDAALQLLKYQVAAAGISGLVAGGFAVWLWGRRKR